MIKRDNILEVVRAWEEEYYDEPGLNNIQVQGNYSYSCTLTVHNGLGAVNPRSKFINKLTFYLNKNSPNIFLNKKRVGTDSVYMNKEAVEDLKKRLESEIQNFWN